ncbi:MAG: DUF2007 domain-containing protein [Chitinophagaceae bacterium]
MQIRTFDSYIDAGITKGRLDEEGITCYLKDAYTVTIDPFLSNAIGGIKLMVLPDDFEEAATILAGYDKNYKESIACPKCGSHEVEYISKAGVKNWLSLMLSWFLLRYPLASEQVYHCYNCSFEFVDLPEAPVNPTQVQRNGPNSN